jgi:hypothetical protein
LVLVILFLLTSCSSREVVPRTPQSTIVAKTLSKVGFSIQVGAFSNADNAVRLTETLQRNGLDAYHFVHRSGLYKVRFGDYPTRKTARKRADFFKKKGIIDQYYIVRPQRRYSQNRIRNKIVKTAKNFIGVPYKWGGSSPQEGFDCSGLTMVVYRLNDKTQPVNERRSGFFCNCRQEENFTCGHLYRGRHVYPCTRQRQKNTHSQDYQPLLQRKLSRCQTVSLTPESCHGIDKDFYAVKSLSV